MKATAILRINRDDDKGLIVFKFMGLLKELGHEATAMDEGESMYVRVKHEIDMKQPAQEKP